MLRPLNEVILKTWFSGKVRLLDSGRIEREKFYPEPGFETGFPAFLLAP